MQIRNVFNENAESSIQTSDQKEAEPVNAYSYLKSHSDVRSGFITDFRIT